MIFVHQCDLSVYRMQLQDLWLVAVVGARPVNQIEHEVEGAISTGESITLAEPIIATLLARRAEATKRGPWVERHYR